MVFAVMLWKMGPQLRAVTPWVALAVVLLMMATIGVMHLLIEGDPVMVRTFAVSNANRHVGLALLVSGRFMHAREALPVVASYAVAVAMMMVIAPRIFKSKELCKRSRASRSSWHSGPCERSSSHLGIELLPKPTAPASLKVSAT